MGGHGGLNILPQKKWNVYRADRQYEVKYDEHRDIEKRLSTREQLKRERLTDSLVELRRKSQAVLNSSTPTDDDPRFNLGPFGESRRRQRDRKASKRGPKNGLGENDTEHLSGYHNSKHDSHNYSHPGNRSRSRSFERDNITSSSATISYIGDLDPDSHSQEHEIGDSKQKAPNGGHINLFEDAEREAEDRAEKRRESLIKSGMYVYNSGGKGPKSVNIYTDDPSVTLVPDFKRQTTPWYMRPHSEGRSEECFKARDRPGGPRYLKSLSTFDSEPGYREEEDLKRSFASRLAQFHHRRQLSKD
ncbi:hypothetical protein BaOVIS_028170 [Babesia ovis]|uniref:CBF1-interacting co-repressor CIR N-terminal domain-containing protein n=1 Tax=Babesia ovis TaxID=5869 RepID=A0A9W5TE91_BABOV|nr:hypothetical protein BaOVIS_028170 [Babesia ovis]